MQPVLAHLLLPPNLYLLMAYQNIFVSLACTPDEDPVVHEAARLTEALGAKLHVLHVDYTADGKMSMMMPSTGRRETVDDLRNQFRRLGYGPLADKLEVFMLVDDSPERAVAEATAEADLLIVGHRNVSAFTAMMRDSVDELISNKVLCPVLVVTKTPDPA